MAERAIGEKNELHTLLQEAGSRKQEAGSRKQEAGKYDTDTRQLTLK